MSKRSQSDTSAAVEAEQKPQENAVVKIEERSALPLIKSDKHAGKPGSFIFDPATGTRTKAA